MSDALSHGSTTELPALPVAYFFSCASELYCFLLILSVLEAQFFLDLEYKSYYAVEKSFKRY